ncbi:MAG: hypothetical protein L0Z73_09320 [Gammaproteobacteria bacterium]|nr:hypothetical protein [Gammaproteobacteria bacterium]
MSALQIRWINYHFAHGHISREEFTSLRKRIAQSEQAQNTDTESQRKVFRLHPQTRRVLAQIRTFKSAARLAAYFLFVGTVCAVYIVADHYKNTGTLNDVKLDVFERYFTHAAPEQPLPSDIKSAAEYLVLNSNWKEQHIHQFMSQWRSLDKTLRKEYQGQSWFRSFSLALSLHIADQRALLKQGDKAAMKRNLALVKLADEIEGNTVL